MPAVKLVKFAPDTAPNAPDQVPDVTVPVVVKLEEPAKGEAPIELYDIVIAVEPLNVEPDIEPVPALLIVSAAVVEPATPVVFWFHVGIVPVNPEYGSPVQFVNVPLVGVPNTGVVNDGLVNDGLVDNTLEPVPVLVETPVFALSKAACANVPTVFALLRA